LRFLNGGSFFCLKCFHGLAGNTEYLTLQIDQNPIVALSLNWSHKKYLAEYESEAIKLNSDIFIYRIIPL